MIANAIRMEREHNSRAWAVWHVAALSKAKKMPSLKKMQIKLRRRKAPLSWQEQDKILTAYSANIDRAKEIRERGYR